MKKPSPPERSSGDPVDPREPVPVFTEAEKRELAGCTFRMVALDGVDFSGANLTEASCDKVSLKRCDFRRPAWRLAPSL